MPHCRVSTSSCFSTPCLLSVRSPAPSVLFPLYRFRPLALNQEAPCSARGGFTRSPSGFSSCVRRNMAAALIVSFPAPSWHHENRLYSRGATLHVAPFLLETFQSVLTIILTLCCNTFKIKGKKVFSFKRIKKIYH